MINLTRFSHIQSICIKYLTEKCSTQYRKVQPNSPKNKRYENECERPHPIDK